MPTPVFETNLKHLTLITRGKVRDIYDVDDKHMMIITTDRLSAFDVVLPQPIPNKGIVPHKFLISGLISFHTLCQIILVI